MHKQCSLKGSVQITEWGGGGGGDVSGGGRGISPPPPPPVQRIASWLSLAKCKIEMQLIS